MAEVQAAEQNILQRKWGPMPVWAWAAIGLVAAWLFAKYRSNQQAATATSTTANASESAATAPEFIIEENLPAVPVGGTPSGPVQPGSGGPVTTPGGTGSRPPIGGGKPPSQGNPVPVKGSPGGNPKPGVKWVPYTVHENDTLSSIAAAHHTTWQNLWTYNTTAPHRDAKAIATLKHRGPNQLFAGEEILVPQ